MMYMYFNLFQLISLRKNDSNNRKSGDEGRNLQIPLLSNESAWSHFFHKITSSNVHIPCYIE